MRLIFNTILFLCLTVFSFAQQQWHYELANLEENQLYPFGDLSLTDNGIVLTLDRQVVEISPYGELKYEQELGGATFSSQYTLVERLADSYLAVGIEGFNTSKTTIKRIRTDNQQMYAISLPNANGNNVGKKLPAATFNRTTQLLFVGSKDSLYLLNANTGQILWRIFQAGQYIDATHLGNDFFALSNAGKISKIDKTGNILWQTAHNLQSNALAVGANQLAIVGENAAQEATLIILNNVGIEISTKTFGAGAFFDIKQTIDGGYILAGENQTNAILVKTDANGTVEWTKSYEGGSTQKVEQAPDGGCYLLLANPNAIIKTDEQGNMTTEKSKLYTKGFGYTNKSNVASVFNADGALFWDCLNAGFEAPKNSGIHSVFAGGLWMSGLNTANSQLHVAAQTYGGGQQDYQPGLVGDSPVLFNKIWKIDRATLRDFKNDISDGVADKPIPHHILTYPAKGNPNFRGTQDEFVQITKKAAPFVDTNNDGIYNALDADYPVMKGDEMLIWLMNDDLTHTQSMGTALAVDVVVTVYSYDCDANATIDNNLFLQFQITNQSANDYADFYLGTMNDFDLGCLINDFFGTDTLSNSFYVYNETANDAYTGCPGGNYGTNIPVQSVTFLNQDLNSHSIFVPTAWGFINNSQVYRNLLTGKWHDGTPITNAGNGYQNGGNVTNYAFSSNPSDVNGWSMCSVASQGGAALNPVGSAGPFDLLQGDVLTLEMVYSFHQNIPHPCPDITANVIPTINTIQNYYDNDELDWEINLGGDKTVDFGSSLTLDPNVQNATAYLWSNGATTPTISVTQPGTYDVTVTNINGCLKTDSINITAYTATEAVMLETKVFPNPANDFFVVELDAAQNATDWSFDLTNAVGQILPVPMTTQNNTQITFSTKGLPTGIYFLQIKKEGQLLKTAKIMVL